MPSNSPSGLGRGKVYPASAAQHLLNPLRTIVQPPGRIIRRMNLSPDSRVLEIGCGPGWFSPILAAAVPGGELTVCDLQREMLELAAVRLGTFPNIRLIQANATATPFADAEFDAILVSSVLGELPDPMGGLSECARVLSPTGTLTVVETRRDSDFLRRRDLIALAARAGLTLSVQFGPPWEYTANFTHAVNPRPLGH